MPLDDLKVGDLVSNFGQTWRVTDIDGDFSISFVNTDENAPMQEQSIVGNWKLKFEKQGFEVIIPNE